MGDVARKGDGYMTKIIDKEAQARQYEVTYGLTTAAGVKKLLRDRHAIGERRYAGDTAASDILLDLNAAIDKARLSRRQAEALAFVYGVDLTQERAAEVMAVSQQAVAKFIDEAARKIAGVYRKWDAADPESRYSEVSYVWDFEEAEGAGAE